MLNHCMDWYK